MLSAFSESLGGKLAESWLATVLTPAFAFWAGGVAAFAYRNGWASVASWFNAQTESLQIATLVLALVGVAVSAEIVNRFDQTIVRLLEGYWPSWLKPLRERLVAREQAKTTNAEERFQALNRELHAKGASLDDASLQQVDEYVTLDEFLRGRPVSANAHMATQLGNILRAAERKPLDKYGLDAIVCWPRLWLLLPDETRDALVSSRHALDSSARAFAWALLFIVWTIFAWWAAPVGVLAALISHRSLVHAASGYGDLVESSFDVHRVRLYEALRWPLPSTPAEERAMGKMLTEYLWRGSGSARANVCCQYGAMRRSKRTLWARAQERINDGLARLSRKVLGSPEARLQVILPRLDLLTKRIGNRTKALESWKTAIVRLCLTPEASPAVVLVLVNVHLRSLIALFSGDRRLGDLIEAVAWRECKSHLRAVLGDPSQTIVPEDKRSVFVKLLKILDDSRYRIALESQMMAALRRSMSRQTNPGLERLVQKLLDDRQMLQANATPPDASSLNDLVGCASLHGSAVATALASTQEDMRSMVVAGVATYGYRFSEYLRLSAIHEPRLYASPASEFGAVEQAWTRETNATNRVDEADARAGYFLDVLTKAPALARVAANHILRLPPGHPLRDVARIRDALNAQIHAAIDSVGTVDLLGPDRSSHLSLALSGMAGLIEHELVSDARISSLIDAGRSVLTNPSLGDPGKSFRLAVVKYLHASATRLRERGESGLADRREAEIVDLLTPLGDIANDPIERRALSILLDRFAGDVANAESTMREMADQTSDDPRTQKAQVAGARMEASRAFGRAQYDRVIERLVPVVPALEEQYLSSVLDEDVATSAAALAESAIQLAFAQAHQQNWDAAVTTLDRTKSLRFRYQSALRLHGLGSELRELEADIHARTRGVPPPAAVRRQTPAGLTDLLETYRQLREKAKVRIASTGVADIAARLEEHEAIVVLGVGPSELLVSIVRSVAGEPSVQSELLPKDDHAAILDALANLRSGWLVALGFKGQFVDPRSSLHRLLTIVDRIIGQPIARMLGDAGISRLILIPHGPLHLVPFWALPSLASFAVMVAPSAAQFVAGRGASRRLDPKALVVGNPTSDLTLAAVEARVVRHHLVGNGCAVDLMEREQATEPALVQAVADASIFHFSGHGRSDFTAPASSALEACAEMPALGQGDDLLLSMAAAAQWQPVYALAGTEWIDDTNQRWTDVAGEGRLVRRVYPSARRIDLRLDHRARGTLLARYVWNDEEGGSEYGERLRVSELWTAGDILTDRCFSACGLAVLSSCEAGAGGVSFSVDESGGLPAALQLAGVAAVVSPLWPVRVEVALLFFDVFYGALTRTRGTADLPALVRHAQRRLRGMRRDEAAAALSAFSATTEGRAARLSLDAASRSVAGSADERPFAHPYDWAAFHVVGAPVLAVPFVGAQTEAVIVAEEQDEEPITIQQEAVETAPAMARRDDVFELGQAAETLLAATDNKDVRALSARFLFDRGMAYHRAGDAEKAFADFSHVAEISHEPSGGPPEGGLYVLAHVQLAGLHVEKGDQLEALKHYDLAIARQDDAASRIGRAHVHAVLDHKNEALEDFGRAIELAPDGDTEFLAYSGRGVVYRSWGRPQDAVEDLTQALVLRPEDSHAYNSRGLALLDLDKPDQAAADFTRASALAPAMTEAHHNHGLACHAVKDYAQAIAYYDAAIAVAPGSLQSYTDRGLAYSDLGDYDRALENYNYVLAEDPNHAAARYNRACALSLKHDMGSILEDLRAATGSDPSLVNHARSDSDLEWARANSLELRALLGMDSDVELSGRT